MVYSAADAVKMFRQSTVSDQERVTTAIIFKSLRRAKDGGGGVYTLLTDSTIMAALHGLSLRQPFEHR